MNISVVFNIDSSLIGLEIGNYKLMKCSEDDESSIYSIIHKFVQSYYPQFLSSFYMYIKDIMEPEESANIYKSFELLVNSFKFYKTSKISFSNTITINDNGGAIISLLTDGYYSHTEGELNDFSLKDNELDSFYKFYKTINTYSGPNLKLIQDMISFYHEASRQKKPQIKFILRVTILELLLDGNAELSYRLSRSVAVLLGKSVEESELIYENTKKLYNARSKYLHEGSSSIPENCYNNATEFSRCLISALYTINKPISDIRKELLKSGYGNNPFNL